MVNPRALLFDIGSTLWSSPAEDPAGLATGYGLAREAMLRELPDAPAMEALIEAVEGYFAEWEDTWRHAEGHVEQAPTSQFVAEALARLELSLSPAALSEFTDALLETSVYTAKVEPPEPGMREALEALQQ